MSRSAHLTDAALAELSSALKRFAEIEGFQAHADAVTAREADLTTNERE